MKLHRHFIIIGFLFLSSFGAEAQSVVNITKKQIDRLIERNGQIVYSAIFAIPETRKDFTDVMGKGSWMSFLPEHLPEQMNKNQKDQVYTLLLQDLVTLNEHKRDAAAYRIQNWVTLFKMLSSTEFLSSKEQVMAAIYANPVSRPLFVQALKTRSWSKSKPSDIAASLSSGETADIQYHLLNILLKMNHEQQIQYFHTLFSYVIRDYKNW